MTIAFACSSCGRKYQVADDWNGRNIRCAKCGRTIVVASTDSPAPPSDKPITLDWGDVVQPAKPRRKSQEAIELGEQDVAAGRPSPEPIDLTAEDLADNKPSPKQGLDWDDLARPPAAGSAPPPSPRAVLSARIAPARQPLNAPFNTYRLVRLIVGGALLAGGGWLAVASWNMPWTFESSGGATRFNRTKSLLMFVALLVIVMGWNLVWSRTSATEKRTRFMSLLPREMKHGYPIATAAFLIAWAAGVQPIIALMAFALGCVGLATVAFGLLRIFHETNNDKELSVLGIDYILIGLLPTAAVAYHWSMYIQNEFLNAILSR